MRDEHYVIAELLEKYPDLNQEEQAQLNTWLEQGENKIYFDRIIDKESLKSALRDLDQLKIESERSWEKLLRIRLNQGQAKVFWFRNWRTYVAAASVVMILGIGGYFYYQFNKGKYTVVKGKETQVPIVADVNPGQYKAKLTLADGSVVVLDTISDKQLVQQGGTNVYSKGGQLIYEKKGKQNEVLYNTLTTAKGEMYGMVLSDGSKLWLNSQSSIRYPVAFSNDVRRVEITGEAYFEVATAHVNGQKEKLPFVVSVNGMEVEVLGTKFNINSYSNEEAIKTTLLEGKVKVRSTSNKVETILQPGQEAKLDKQSKQLNKQDDIDVDEAVAWHYGYFQFNNADLETVMRQLVRWYDVEIIYQGAVPQREFWGKISRKNTLSQVLETLEKNNVHFKLEGKRIIVSP